MSRAFYNSAENLGYVRDLYTLIEDHGQPPDMIDRAWRVYEPGLPDGIAALIDSHARPLRADVWTRVLVPFVVGLFVRGPEFNRRFETRLVPIIGTTSTFFTPTRITDNTNQARLFEMQRLMFPIATAEWTVVHCTGSGIAITSDVGYCLMRHLQGGGVGYAIPLRPDAVLVLRKGPHHLIAHSAGGSWVMGGIQHAAGAPETISGLNTAIATTAMAEVYGPTERVVDTSAQAWQHGNSPSRMPLDRIGSRTTPSSCEIRRCLGLGCCWRSVSLRRLDLQRSCG